MLNAGDIITFWRWVLCLPLACSAPAALAAASELQPFIASYGITWNGISAGSAELELKNLGDGRWSYDSRRSTRALFRIALPAELDSSSIFRIENGQIVPQQFTVDDGTRGDARDQQITFDWTAGRVTGVAERKPVDLPAQPGLLDNLSVQVAVMHQLLTGRTPQHFVVVAKDRIRDYAYTAEGNETLRIAVGEHRTVKFRIGQQDSRKSLWLWCAPDLGYLPLKVEGREGANVEWSMTVKSLTVGATTL